MRCLRQKTGYSFLIVHYLDEDRIRISMKTESIAACNVPASEIDNVSPNSWANSLSEMDCRMVFRSLYCECVRRQREKLAAR